MLLTKFIRLQQFSVVVNFANSYHSSVNFRPSTKRISSGGFLTEDQWFERKNFTIKHEDLTPGGRIIDQSAHVDSRGIQFNTWNKFSEIEDLDKRLLEVITHTGHDTMTPIQKNTFDILNRQLLDLLGSAETGSGKTLAYLSPILNNILKNYPNEMMRELKSGKGEVQYPLFLVLAPTRELVEQITKEAHKLLKLTRLRVTNAIGGVHPSRQIMELQDGCHSLIATPGRLRDFLQKGYISLKYCNQFVLDEADRMLDMGFEPQVRQIVEDFDLPGESTRHTSMFSATFPDDVLDLAQSLMKQNFGQALIGRNAGSNDPCIPDSIKQNFALSSPLTIYKDCFEYLKNSDKKTIVFCNRKDDIEVLSRFGRKYDIFASILHGNLKQASRNSELYRFKKGDTKVLMATSIAARGLDVSDVECVINVGLPMSIDDYIHRVGRCGRLGRPGEAMTFISDEDLGGAVTRDLIKMLRRTNKEFPSFLLDKGKNKPISTPPPFRRVARPFQAHRSNYNNRYQYEGESKKDRYMR